MICTGCALLCDDIEENDCVKHACRIGRAHITSMQETRPMVAQEIVGMDVAIKSAADILADAENPIFVGFGNCITETQETGITLAEKIGAGIQTFHTEIFDDILDGALKTCTLPEVRDYADVVVFWGTDPMNTHPRLLSKYAYYPRGEKRQRGWEEDRTAITIDIRESYTASICRDTHIIPPHGHADFMGALMDALRNKVPKTAYDKKRILKLAGVLKKAEFGVLFAGADLIRSVPRDMLIRLMEQLNSVSDFRILPLVPGYNLRSIAAQLHGRPDRGDGGAGSGSGVDLQDSDCVLCLGFDLMNSLPADRINGKTIVIDPNETLQSRYADVVIPCAAGGVDCAGTAVRMDGINVELLQSRESERISDQEIMRQLLEVV